MGARDRLYWTQDSLSSRLTWDMHVSRLQKILHRDKLSLEPTFHVHWRAVPGVQHLLICPINKLEARRGCYRDPSQGAQECGVGWKPCTHFITGISFKERNCSLWSKKNAFLIRNGNFHYKLWGNSKRTLHKVINNVGASDNVVGWGTMLQARRSRVRFRWVHWIF
jgi:hypothetical protein